MAKNHSQEQLCTETLKLFGDFWTLRIIEALQHGPLRYCEVQRAVDNLNPTTLANRLQKLESAGLVLRTEDTVDKISVSYSLTSLGHESLPILNALETFSKKVTKHL